MTAPIILVTGTPGIGKTTLVRSVVERLERLEGLGQMRMSGFYTGEIRQGSSRTGFGVTTLDGKTGRLATVGGGDGRDGKRIGNYRVDLVSFEERALPSLELRPDVSLYVVDEIGKMECLSTPFVEAVRQLADADVPLLASVALHGSGFIDEMKAHPRAELVHVSRTNRDELVEQICSMLSTRAR